MIIRIRGSGDRADKTLLETLRSEHPELSRAKLKHLFQTGAVLLRGRPLDAAHVVPTGEHEIEIHEDDLQALSSRPEAKAASRGFSLPIIFEDDELLVLNKPSGVPSAPQGAQETETAVGSALVHFPPLAGVGYGGLEPGLLHRLDTGTSGALAFAKTRQAFERLKPLWSSGEVRKVYRAICAPLAPGALLPPVPSEHRFLLAHDAKTPKRMLALDSARRFEPRRIRGKTHPTFTRLVRTRNRSSGRVDLEIEIRTGVMHQIRCTLLALGWPVVGDPIYKGAPADRLWLHAWKLEIPTPNGAVLHIEAPLPADWPEVAPTF